MLVQLLPKLYLVLQLVSLGNILALGHTCNVAFANPRNRKKRFLVIFKIKIAVLSSDLMSSVHLPSSENKDITPPKTHRISGLKSQVLKPTFLVLKMMVKSGLEFCIQTFSKPLPRYLLTCQANSAFLGRFLCTVQLQL